MPCLPERVMKLIASTLDTDTVMRGVRKVKLCLLTAVILLAFTGSAWAGVDAWLDTNKVNMGESVQLTIRADRKVSGEPDIGPLKKDFDVLQSSSSTSINFTNGSLSASTSWYYTLSPKRKGRLVIPPIEVDGERTPELVLEVAGTGKPSADSGQNIFIETSCSPRDPLVQQQVICTVRLYSAREISQGSLTELESDNAIVHRLGKDSNFNRIINSRRYRVIERRYAVFPQASGSITLSAPVFSGTVLIPRAQGRNDPFSSFLRRDPFFSHGLPGLAGAERQVNIRGNAVKLEVKPRPSDFSGPYWLPAQSMTLSEQWEPDTAQVHAGEPVTRTVIIAAKGLTAEQLPDLTPEKVAGCSIYPDRAELKNSEHSTGITGRRVQKIAFIPEKSGKVTIPPVKLQWWNTVKDKMETATLPGKEVTVLPASGKPQETPGHAQEAIKTPNRQGNAAMARSGNVPASGRPSEVTTLRPADSFYMWLSIILGTAWLITLLLLFLEKQRKGGTGITGPADIKNGGKNTRQLRNKFRDACSRNDAPGAKKAILEWASAVWPENPPAGLEELAGRITDEKAREELKALNHTLYSGATAEWKCGPGLSGLKKLSAKKKAGKHGHEGRLPPLYASRQ